MRETKAEYLPIEKLRPFEGHPFKVADNAEMDQLVETILAQGHQIAVQYAARIGV